MPRDPAENPRSAEVGWHVHAFLRNRRAAEERFLAELVRVPSDNPPGDCHPHAERTAVLLDALGLTAEKHPVPEAIVNSHRIAAVTKLLVRHRHAGGTEIRPNDDGDGQ